MTIVEVKSILIIFVAFGIVAAATYHIQIQVFVAVGVKKQTSHVNRNCIRLTQDMPREGSIFVLYINFTGLVKCSTNKKIIEPVTIKVRHRDTGSIHGI